MKHDIPLTLSRHCFTPRDVARAGDIWRSFQDAALVGSARVGWPPSRYREEGVAFIVRTMTVVHHREIVYGEPVQGKTWVSEFRRRIITPRQIVLYVEDEPVAAATQEWVHVRERIKEGLGLAPSRASAEMIADFSPVPEGPVATMPAWEGRAGPIHRFEIEVWNTDMDPLAHANHPLYLDWCDEATSRVLRTNGVDPHKLVPVAEWVKWRQAVCAPERIEVRTERIGQTASGATVLRHEMFKLCEPEVLAAEAITVRELIDGPGSLMACFD